MPETKPSEQTQPGLEEADPKIGQPKAPTEVAPGSPEQPKKETDVEVKVKEDK